MEGEGLTYAQTSKKFGVSAVTIWKWRRDAKAAGRRRQPREVRSGRMSADGSLAALVRAGLQARVRKLLPSIVREEVVRALGLKH